MGYQLTGLRAGAGKAQAVHHVVQPGFQQAQQVFTRDAGHFFSHLEIVAELALQHAVVTAGILLGAQLTAVFGLLLVAGLTVLARRISAAGDGAFACVAAFALQKEFLTFAAAELARRTGISSHIGCTS